MRKILISAAAAASALVVASPASAQAYGNIGPAYGYGAPYGYGYQQNYGAVRWGAQLQQMRYELGNLARQGRLTYRERQILERDLFQTQQTLQSLGRRGISPWEARVMDQRMARLRGEMRRFADYDRGNRWGRGYNGYNAYNGYNGYNGYNAYNAYNGYYAGRERDRDDENRWNGDDD